MKNFADRLGQAIAAKRAPVCVGFDPVLERLPGSLLQECGVHLSSTGKLESRTKPEAIEQALVRFGQAVLDEVRELVPAIKINIAFFEPHYAAGIRAYFELVKRFQADGLIVIGDVKRGDIGHSAAEYAAAHLGKSEYRAVHGTATPDAVTLSPYLGLDCVSPFLDLARREGKGAFVLVQTSNPSAREIQGQPLGDGRSVAECLAGLVAQWANQDGLLGRDGYSCLGAVVAPVDIETTLRLRQVLDRSIFLVPGYGAQGRSAEEVARCFKADGTGAVVNASRSVIFAYEDPRYLGRWGSDWRRCVREACQEFVTDVRRIIKS